MAHQKPEIKTYFGKCKCCLNYAYLKSMWKEEWNEGKSVYYGKMLVECFSINWTVNSKPEDDRICDQCISKLKDAITFKNQVIKCQIDILNEVDKVDQDENERMKRVRRPAEVDQNSYEYIEFCDEDSDLEDNIDSQVDKMEEDERNVKDTEMLEEYISMDDDEDETNDRNQTKLKWPKKLPPSERNKSYRQYSSDQLEVALQAVKCQQMTCQEAADKYNIPRRTLSTKLSLPEKQTETSNKMKSFIQGIKDILTHTNATPFKIRGNKFYCFFCPQHDSPAYDDPKLLREHTNTHTDKVSNVEFAVRPHYQHEVIRLDIDEFTCNCTVKASWYKMLEHLKEHNVNVDDVKENMIPFTLTATDMPCVLCEYNSCFINIDHHMNLHSKNYICGNCGNTFCSKSRLNFHSKLHDTGANACSFCDKVFNREIHKKRHEDSVHRRKPKFKCSYCDEAFLYESARHKHMEKKHREKYNVKVWHCIECPKSFTWVPSYRQHMRLVHNLGYSCSECNKHFSTEKTLSEHKLLHRENDKSAVCYDMKRKRKNDTAECLVDENVSGLEKPSTTCSEKDCV